MIFSSVGDADHPKLSPKVEHFWAKADIEKYMAETLAGTTTQWSFFVPWLSWKAWTTSKCRTR